MDPLEEFLSPEALRLLLDSDDFATTADQPSVSTSDQSLSLNAPTATAVDIPSPEESKPTRKRVACDANIAGCSTLVLDKAGSAKPKRAKFSAEGRAKVASVRKKGACMRCYRHKISCSGEWPCESCCRSHAIIAGRASRHRWMGCVPFSMKDLDIFAHEIVKKDYLTDESLNSNFGFSIVDFLDIWLDEREFAISGTSTLELGFAIMEISFRLPSRNPLTPGSKNSNSNRIDSRLDKTFQSLAITYMLRFIGDNNSLTGKKAEDLRNAQSVARSQLLQCLEKTLSSSSLSNLGADELRALMMILLFTVAVAIWSRPRFQSSPEFHDRQQQLVRVLTHHVLYIGERLHLFENLNKENVIRQLTSIVEFTKPLHPESESNPHAGNNSSHNMHNHFPSRKGHGKADNSVNPHSMTARNTSRGPIKRHNEPLEETSEVIPPALDQREGDISQSTLYTEVDTMSEPNNDWGVVQRHATAKSPYLADPRPEDRYWTFSDHNELEPAISTITAASLPELQPDTVCSWCGCLWISYKPSQGVVSCDRCFTPHQPYNFTASGWDIGEYQNTEQSVNPASGLNNSQGVLVNYALRPEVTTSGSHGNDLDDFSWFMAS